MQIRALTEADLPAFAEHFDEGNPAQLTRALRFQAEDTGLMLAAWIEDRPVGRVLVHWRAVPGAPAEWHTGFAFLEELIIIEAHRSQGIGTAIMQEAERLARERGFTTIAVGAGVNNDRARALYERLGYMDAGLGSFEDRGTFLNSRGEQIDWHETWIFVTKAVEAARTGVDDARELAYDVGASENNRAARTGGVIAKDSGNVPSLWCMKSVRIAGVFFCSSAPQTAVYGLAPRW